MHLFPHTLVSQTSYKNMSFCFPSISRRKPISELRLVTSGFDFTWNAEARSVVRGEAMTPCLQSVVHFCSSLGQVGPLVCAAIAKSGCSNGRCQNLLSEKLVPNIQQRGVWCRVCATGCPRSRLLYVLLWTSMPTQPNFLLILGRVHTSLPCHKMN